VLILLCPGRTAFTGKVFTPSSAMKCGSGCTLLPPGPTLPRALLAITASLVLISLMSAVVVHLAQVGWGGVGSFVLNCCWGGNESEFRRGYVSLRPGHATRLRQLVDIDGEVQVMEIWQLRNASCKPTGEGSDELNVCTVSGGSSYGRH